MQRQFDEEIRTEKNKTVTQLVAHTKIAPREWRYFVEVAEPTGLEPATSDVTGRRSNQLNYDSAKLFLRSEISDLRSFGRHGGIRTPNLFLVREAVYH
jgi:hypothetical protein